MKLKRKILVFFFLVVILLTACSKEDRSTDFISYIQTPKNDYVPLKGTWKLVDLSTNSKNDKEVKSVINLGDYLYISNRIFAFGDRYTVFPQYTAKYVNYKSYMEKSFVDNINLGYSKDDIEVLRVVDSQNFSQEVMKISDDQAILSFNSFIYRFEKVSDEIDSKIIDSYIIKYSKANESPRKEKVSNDVSLLLGIKEKIEEDDSPDRYTYKTILIRIKKDQEPEIFETKDLIIPREEGFWKMDYRLKEGENSFAFYPLNKEVNKENEKILTDKLNRNITFLNDDYISFRKLNFYSISDNLNYKYEIRELDKFDDKVTLKIQDIGGPEALDIYEDLINKRKAFYESNFGSSKDISISVDPSNIGVERNLNSWQYFTTMEILRDDLVHFHTSSLSIVQQQEIINSNEKQSSIVNIRGKIPSASQAFTFPNNDYIVIKNDNEIFLCRKNGDSVGRIISSIPLNDKTDIIMAEYGLESYSELWRTEFLKFELETINVINYDQ